MISENSVTRNTLDALLSDLDIESKLLQNLQVRSIVCNMLSYYVQRVEQAGMIDDDCLESDSTAWREIPRYEEYSEYTERWSEYTERWTDYKDSGCWSFAW